MRHGYAALRAGRYSHAGQAYLITFATSRRRAIFADAAVARNTCRWLSAPATWGNARLLAWVLMPDHWHGIVQLGAGSGLSHIVGQAKGRVSRAIRLQHPEIHAVWQAGFHDRALRADADLLPAARYVIANPVRAGLVRRVGEYPYWDCSWL
jgi:REP element-mobilizing transposase RayT